MTLSLLVIPTDDLARFRPFFQPFGGIDLSPRRRRGAFSSRPLAILSSVSQLSPGPELEPDFRGYEPIHPEPGWKSLLRKLWGPIAVVVGLIVKFGFFIFKFFGLFISIGAYALIWGWKF